MRRATLLLRPGHGGRTAAAAAALAALAVAPEASAAAAAATVAPEAGWQQDEDGTPRTVRATHNRSRVVELREGPILRDRIDYRSVLAGWQPMLWAGEGHPSSCQSLERASNWQTPP